MGFLQSILDKIRGKKLIQSAALKTEALNEMIQSETERLERSDKMLQLDREALEIGVAAGYVGRALRHIEDSLLRIESMMTTKEWFKAEYQDLTPQLMQILQFLKQLAEQHEKNEQIRFNHIQDALKRLESVAEKAPEEVKTEILAQTEKIKAGINLKGKKKEIWDIINERKKISYEDLQKLSGYKDVSTIRALISAIRKTTDRIETFTINKKGWVRLKEV